MKNSFLLQLLLMAVFSSFASCRKEESMADSMAKVFCECVYAHKDQWQNENIGQIHHQCRDLLDDSIRFPAYYYTSRGGAWGNLDNDSLFEIFREYEEKKHECCPLYGSSVGEITVPPEKCDCCE